MASPDPSPSLPAPGAPEPSSFWRGVAGLAVEHGVVASVLAGLVVLAGLAVAPFPWDGLGLPRDPVPVDAIPDLGAPQQIVFTPWPGRSPRDVEDQVTYPLTTALLGIPEVATVRSSSAFGFSSIYVVFEEDADPETSRTRVLEKLAALPGETLPAGVRPQLGPDATALGQVFWYTLEGRAADGRTVGGFDLHELRAAQDWTIRYALQSVPGVAEVASVGGHVREIHVEVDPDALLGADVTLGQVVQAVRRSNRDVGARTLEVNRVEYVVRGLGLLEDPADLEDAVVAHRGDTPVRVRDVARVGFGPGPRRGVLDDAGAEVVGGVVVARRGANPMEVVAAVREKIEEIGPGLPRRTLEDGTEARVSIVPFYDRGVLVGETLDTLSTALTQQLLVTALVVLLALRRIRSAVLVVAVLPLAVLGAFVAMKLTGVEANVMALAGIAIAIGTMVDVGIVFVENVVARLEAASPSTPRGAVVRDAVAEVAPAVVTSVLTTVVSFLPVFALVGGPGRLFRPLALTKTYAMGLALLLTLVLVPPLAVLVFRPFEGPRWRPWARRAVEVTVGVGIALALVGAWMPLGPGVGFPIQLVFVALVLGLVLGAFLLFQRGYPTILRWSLAHPGWAVIPPIAVVVLGAITWLGADRTLGWLPSPMGAAASLARGFPGLGREDMPPFDEGTFLYMPTTMPHASVGQARALLGQMDAAIAAVPEVDRVVGKLGRVDSPLDPAPVSMFETVVTMRPEFRVDEDGRSVRQWRDHVRTQDDVWDEIARAADLPGLTGAPPLMPIATRLVMLQSGMRAPVGVRIRGPDLETNQRVALAVDGVLREVPGVDPTTVQVERLVGKPYLELDIDRRSLARHGLTVEDVQRVIEVAQGGERVTTALDGRARLPVRVRYPREERGDPDVLGRLLVATPSGSQVPLGQLVDVRYERGPQVIKSEDTFPVTYVTFSGRTEPGSAEGAPSALVDAAQRRLDAALADGSLVLPDGVSLSFAGAYEQLLETEARLTVLVPLALALVFLLLHVQFRRVSTTLVIFTGVLVSVGAGFLILAGYGVPGLLDVVVFGQHLGDLFRVGTVNLSVATWVGIIALVGIATDNGVVLASYLARRFAAGGPPTDRDDVRARAFEAGMRRLRPCLMTSATTVIALLPVITAQGRGADVMLPMALPIVGGMVGALMTLVLVPVLYAAVEERRLGRSSPA